MKNYEKLHKDKTVQLNITTSVSLFNWPTLTTFIDYLQEQGLAPWAIGNGGAWQPNPYTVQKNLVSKHCQQNTKSK